jgi:protease II
MTFEYPKARRAEDKVERFHDVDVPDPYHWLSEETPEKEECKALSDCV